MTAYYNENDPYAAAWLRNLIKENLIAPGDVDERGIIEVRADDLRGYKQVHFFAGIGGWSIALRLADCDDESEIWTGSCPCQSISVAGHRRGHADERHLWPAFYRLISECHPPIIFGEQVASKDGREWLSALRADLEHSGYAIGAADLPAAIKTPQIRQRLWWMARSMCIGREMRWDFEAVNGETEKPSKGRAVARRGGQAVEYEWIREPPIQLLSNAVPYAMAKLRAYGNAIVPQVAAEFIMASIKD